jgi:Xaa-Pro aminopeptidase
MNEEKQKLILAEKKAKELFTAIEGLALITPGKSESELTAEIVEIAKSHFGITSFWHKKIVRAGANTLCSYTADPPDGVIQEDDIVILDFGPIFEGYEADIGRTYVIGNDPLKVKLKKDVEDAWYEAKDWYYKQSSVTGAAYFKYCTALAKKYGWEFTGDIAGHIVGHYPHKQLVPDDLGLDIHPGNNTDLLQPDRDGDSHHWILELQFVDRANGVGAYFEQLL